jgi:DivIVA domain-containing protein
MPLTPADVHNLVFKRPSIGRRGYDEEQVNAFLAELEQELIRLIEENNELRSLLAPAGAPSGADPQLATALDEMTAQLDHARREWAAAQQAVRETQAELELARLRSSPVTNRDHGEAFQVLATAERSADNHVGEAHREAHDLLSRARSTARQLTSDAQAKADALEQDARQRHHETIGGLDARRIAAQHQIDELKAFEREYRTRLRAHVEGQLRGLHRSEPDQDGRGEVAP